MFNAQRRQGRGQDKRERQAKPKIWEALGAKPIRHKLLQAKPKAWEEPTARARTCVPLAKSRVWEEGVPSRTRAGETTRGQGRRRDHDDGSSGRAAP